MKTKIDITRTVYRLIETDKNGLSGKDRGGFDDPANAGKRAKKLNLKYWRIETWQ